MRANISANMRAAMAGNETGEVVVMLITISHPDLPDGNLYLSSDNDALLDFEQQLRGTISRGQAFSFIPMDLSLPEEGDDASEVIGITFSNISQESEPLLKATTLPALVSVELVLASAPDLVEVEFPFFELTSSDVTAEQVTLSLSVDSMASEPFPADNFTPSTFGGLWATT